MVLNSSASNGALVSATTGLLMWSVRTNLHQYTKNEAERQGAYVTSISCADNRSGLTTVDSARRQSQTSGYRHVGCPDLSVRGEDVMPQLPCPLTKSCSPQEQWEGAPSHHFLRICISEAMNAGGVAEQESSMQLFYL